MLGRAADLIAFERLGIVDGDGDAAVIRGEVAQRRVQEHIADDELAIVRHVLERDRHYVRHAGAAGARSHMFSLSSFLTFSLSMIRSSLWFFELVFRIADHTGKTRYPQIYERLINFIAAA